MPDSWGPISWKLQKQCGQYSRTIVTTGEVANQSLTREHASSLHSPVLFILFVNRTSL